MTLADLAADVAALLSPASAPGRLLARRPGRPAPRPGTGPTWSPRLTLGQLGVPSGRRRSARRCSAGWRAAEADFPAQRRRRRCSAGSTAPASGPSRSLAQRGDTLLANDLVSYLACYRRLRHRRRRARAASCPGSPRPPSRSPASTTPGSTPGHVAPARRGDPRRPGRDRARRPPPAAAASARTSSPTRSSPTSGSRSATARRTAMPRHDHYIGGRVDRPRRRRLLREHQPGHRRALYEAARGNAADVDRAVAAARAAFEDPRWRDLSQTRRGRLLRDLGDLIGENAEELARTETLDNGKLLREMRGPAGRRCPSTTTTTPGSPTRSRATSSPALGRELLNYTLREPLGVVGRHHPVELAAAADHHQARARRWRAGNTMVIKPSEHTSASLLRLAELVDGGRLPAGRRQRRHRLRRRGRAAALVDHPDAGQDLLHRLHRHRRADRRAAGVSGFIGCTLELGGKSPNIVFADAELAERRHGRGRRASSPPPARPASRAAGCSPHKSHLRRAAGAGRRARAAASRSATRSTTPPSWARWRSRTSCDKVAGYVELGRHRGRHGAHRRPGRRRRARRLLLRAHRAHRRRQRRCGSCREEIFGPVAAIMPFDDRGRGRSARQRHRVRPRGGRLDARPVPGAPDGRRLEAGTVWVNTYRAMSPMSPAAGFKNSGMGIEHGTGDDQGVHPAEERVDQHQRGAGRPIRSSCEAEPCPRSMYHLGRPHP